MARVVVGQARSQAASPIRSTITPHQARAIAGSAMLSVGSSDIFVNGRLTRALSRGDLCSEGEVLMVKMRGGKWLGISR